MKCPKCRKPPEKYIEGWDTWITFFADARGVPEEEGVIGQGFPSGKVYAVCGCGYRWTLRKVSQITDLLKEPTK